MLWKCVSVLLPIFLCSISVFFVIKELVICVEQLQDFSPYLLILSITFCPHSGHWHYGIKQVLIHGCWLLSLN